MEMPDVEVVICHCTQSHRFVVSLVEITDGSGYEAGAVANARFAFL
jgi:hypothetical protein